jgi:hypothetical protein
LLNSRNTITTKEDNIMNKPVTFDRLHAVSETTVANPESITWIPDTMNAAQLNQFARVLGVHGELKAAAVLNEQADIGMIDAALSKTGLSISERMKAKILLLGSGFGKGAY